MDYYFTSAPSYEGDLYPILVELYSTQYVLATMQDRVARVDPARQYLKSWEAMVSRYQAIAMELAQVAKASLLSTMQEWLLKHSIEGMTQSILEDEYSVDSEGNYTLGGDFSYPLKDIALDHFLTTNEYFIDQFIEGAQDPDDPDPSLDSMSQDDKISYVKEYIDATGYSWNQLCEWLSPFGFDDSVAQIIKDEVYPEWRAHWGGQIDQVEINISNAYKRLQSASTLDDLYVAINLALQAEHVSGTMGENSGLSSDELNQLSNLDTNALDQIIIDRIGLKAEATLSSFDLVHLVSEGVVSTNAALCLM